MPIHHPARNTNAEVDESLDANRYYIDIIASATTAASSATCGVDRRARARKSLRGRD